MNTGELRLVAVGPEWPLRFSAERDRLSSALGPAAIDIQHVGSTAIPGLHAKPILDIAVAIDSFESGQPLVPLLENLGYRYRGENGIARRHYFVRGTPRRTHHLHVLEHHSTQWAGHICFRDRLLASRELAASYSELKRACLSEAAGHRGLYQSLKASFITRTQGADAC